MKIWKNACEKSNVEGAIPRDLRHRSITDMKIAGHNDAHVGNVAGHPGDDLAPGTLNSILKQAKLKGDE